MAKPKILQILSMYHPEGERLLRQEAEVIQTDRYDIAHLCERVKDMDGILVRAPAKITREVIDAAPSLKIISGSGVGLDNIDLKYATDKNIPVLHAPSINGVSTAEHAITLIMALSKSLVSFHEEMRKGNYNSRMTLQSRELRGKRVGIVGLGNIGKEVAKRVKLGLEMEVTAWIRKNDKNKQELADKLGIKLTTSLDEIFFESDFVTLHIPLNLHTQGFINRHHFSLMKPTAYFVNTARGVIVNQDDLYEVLSDGRIAGAGLDVYDLEPPAKDLALLSLPNVILTPHVGGTTVECNYIGATTVAKNILRFFAGERPETIANPEVLDNLVDESEMINGFIDEISKN